MAYIVLNYVVKAVQLAANAQKLAWAVITDRQVLRNAAQRTRVALSLRRCLLACGN